jgi:DNA ligase-1
MLKNVKINIFDCLEFNGVNIENKLLSERIEFITKSINSSNNIVYVPFQKIETDINIINKYLDTFIDSGYEGLILKADSPYIRKKTIEWCKVKKKDNMDIRVIDIEEGTGKYKNMVGALICELDNGKKVNVGSGLDDEFRKFYWKKKNRNDIIDKYIEIEFQELTNDGKPRFPVFVRIRDDKS